MKDIKFTSYIKSCAKISLLDKLYSPKSIDYSLVYYTCCMKMDKTSWINSINGLKLLLHRV